MKSVLALVLLFSVAYANHYAYIGFFENSNCNGDPVAVNAMYPGAAEFCYDASASSCLRTFRDSRASSCFEAEFSEGSNGVIESDGTNSDEIPFNTCLRSSVFTECYYEYRPLSNHFTVNGDGAPNDNSFVAYLNYFTDNTCASNELEYRKPVFDEGVTLCDDSAATGCTGALRGYQLPDSNPNKDCNTFSVDKDGCTIDISTQSYDIGECTLSGRFVDCGLQYTDGSGFGNCDNDDDDDRSLVKAT